MRFVSTLRGRAGRGKGMGGGTGQLLLPQVGPFANLPPALVNQQPSLDISGTILLEGGPTNPDMYGTLTLEDGTEVDGSQVYAGMWLWCDYLQMIGQNFLIVGAAEAAGAATSGHGGNGANNTMGPGAGGGAAANTTVGTYAGGQPGSISHPNGFAGAVANGYVAGTGGIGYAAHGGTVVTPQNWNFGFTPTGGAGGDVVIGASTNGAGGGGGPSGGVICIVCNRWSYDQTDPVNNVYISTEGQPGGTGFNTGNGGNGGDGGIIAIFTKNKMSKGGKIGAPFYNFDTVPGAGGAGGVPGVAGRNGRQGPVQFWEIRSDNTLVYHYSPNDVWNNL